MPLNFALERTTFEDENGEEHEGPHGDPWLSYHQGELTIGFEYSNRVVRLAVSEDRDRVFLEAWCEHAERKLRDVLPIYPEGYKGYGTLLSGGSVNAEEMYIEATDEWSRHLCMVACPNCGKNGKPLIRKGTFYVGGGMRWVGLDYQEPISDYRTSCPRCHTDFKFTIYTPQ